MLRYGNEQIFNNLSFKIDGKKTVAIVGSTGSGKSTLAHFLPRLYEVESGTIKIDNVDIQDLALNELRKMYHLHSKKVFYFQILQKIIYLLD